MASPTYKKGGCCMKKVVSFVLALCLLAGLCGCSDTPIKVKKFGSVEEMQSYVQGVWDCYGDLYFIDGDQLYHEYSGVEGRIDYYTDSLNDIVKKQGADAVSQLTVKDQLAKIEKDWFTVGKTLQFNHNKGTITYEEDGMEQILYVGEGVLCLDLAMEKISDTPSYTVPGLVEAFEEAHAEYKPSSDAFKLTPEKYAQALKELHPDAKSYPLATSDGSHAYTDTGLSQSGCFTAALGWTDSKAYYISRANTDMPYRAEYGADLDQVLVQSVGGFESWETMAADALAIFGGMPDIPTPEELATQFREKGETRTETGTISSTTITEYKTEIAGATCTMQQFPTYRILKIQF